LTDTLPDGSVVTLNKQSEISYPSKFKGDSRPVQLKGEAFFNVTPNKKKPFIITVGDVEVRVVGTSFNIESNDEATVVDVKTGVVLVTRNGSITKLNAGEMLKLEKNRNIKQPAGKRLYNYYEPRIFNCENTPLWKLVDAVNKVYDTTLVITNPAIRDLRLNAPFYNQSLKEIVDIVSKTIYIEYEFRGDTIILK